MTEPSPDTHADPRPGPRTRRMLGALFVLVLVVIMPPVMQGFDDPLLWLGWPAPLVWLGLVWTGVILALYIAGERRRR